ncbi:MAG: hypothetical protein J6T10_22585 [Methanobrevibacter sp.]|nr:hypothetical protein [Methanobrevibacter sp.]
MKNQLYVVYVEYDNGFEIENHCILHRCNLQIAKSIRRNLSKKLGCDRFGYHVGIASRKCCLNFRDFEIETFSPETETEYILLLNGEIDLKSGELL